MNKIFTVSILGCGSRGREAYGKNFYLLKDKFKIECLCDINPKQIDLAKKAWDFLMKIAFYLQRNF